MLLRILQGYGLLILLILAACQPASLQHIKFTANSALDSIQKNYNLSQDESLSSELRIDHINQAYHRAQKLQNDSLQLKTITYKTQLHSSLNQVDSAIIYSHNMRALAEKIKDSLFIGRAYYKLGLYHEKKFAIDSAYYHYHESVKYFEQVHNSLYAAKALLNTAVILSDIGDYSGSDQTAVEALVFMENLDEKVLKASTYNCLAISAKKQEDYQEALYWYDLALNTTENKENKLSYLNNIANVHRNLGLYQKAIGMYEPLLLDSLLNKDLRQKAMTMDNLAYAKWLMTGDQQLIDDFNRALNIRTDIQNTSGQITSNYHLAEFYKNQDLNQSRYHANHMFRLATQENNVDDRLQALTLLMELYKDDLPKYQEYSATYIHLNDSLQNIRKSAKNQFAKIKYDSEKNRAENSILKTKSIQRQLALEKSNRLKTTYLSLGLLLLVSFVFIYFQLKANNKKQRLLEVYHTETRISKKVHDEVANDVYQLMTKLQHNTEQEEVLDDLEEIYVKTRDISKEHHAINFKKDFAIVLKDLLLNYQNDKVNIITKDLSKINWKIISDVKKTAIYRVLQELMTNMKKHSEAGLVVCSFSRELKKIVIEYKDDGVGCALKKNTGLQNAENRIETLKGRIIFDTEMNRGFKVTITI